MKNKLTIFTLKQCVALYVLAVVTGFSYICAAQLVTTGYVYMASIDIAYKTIIISPLVWGMLVFVSIAVRRLKIILQQNDRTRKVTQSAAVIALTLCIVAIGLLITATIFTATGGFGKSIAQQFHDSPNAMKKELSGLTIFNGVTNGDIRSGQDGSNLTGGDYFAKTSSGVIVSGRLGELRGAVESNLARQGYSWDKSFYQELGDGGQNPESIALRYNNQAKGYSLLVRYIFIAEQTAATPASQTYNGEYDASQVKSAFMKLGPTGLNYPF